MNGIAFALGSPAAAEAEEIKLRLTLGMTALLYRVWIIASSDEAALQRDEVIEDAGKTNGTSSYIGNQKRIRRVGPDSAVIFLSLSSDDPPHWFCLMAAGCTACFVFPFLATTGAVSVS